MKRLDFPVATDDLDLYNTAYVGLNNPEARLSPPELRTHAKILDKFEGAGVPDPDGKRGHIAPKGKGVTIILEDAELALTKRLCESMHWNPAASRKVVKLLDLLDAAPDYIVPAPDPAPQA
jgi:hypothetical protein